MEDVDPLSPQLLDELESLWRKQLVPLVERLQPGLSDAEMDALTEPLGLRLPPEARLWWGWHDGVEGEGDHAMVGRGWRYISLAEAVAQTIDTRRFAWNDPVLGKGHWPETWLPWCLEKGYLAIDCADPDAACAPVHAYAWEGGAVPGARAPSMGTAVRWWIDALQSGAAEHVPGRGWHYDWRALPAERERTRVV